MNGAIKNQRLLSVLLKVVARPFSRNVSYIRIPNLSRSFTAAIPRREPIGFSVSFAPEPDEPEREHPSPTNSPAKKAKSKRKPGEEIKNKEISANKARGKKKSGKKAEAPREQESTPVYESEGTPDHVSAVAVLENPPTSPQKQEKHTHTEQAKSKATRNTSVADSDCDKAVELGFEEKLLIADGLTTESSESENYLRGALGGGKEHAKTTPDNSQTAAERKKKREEASRRRATKIIIDSGFLLGNTPIKPQAQAEPTQTTTQSLSRKIKREKPGSRDLSSSSSSTAPTSPSPIQKVTLKSSSVDPISKTDIQTKAWRPPPPKKEPWQVQKQALKNKFGSEGWNPRKKLSPDTIDGIRALHEQYPDKYPTAVLAGKFKISPEAVRRILKSKWRPDPEKQVERRERWARRHDRIWDQQAAIGLRPARTKVKKPVEPDEVDEKADIEEFHLARARKQATDTHLTDES